MVTEPVLPVVEPTAVFVEDETVAFDTLAAVKLPPPAPEPAKSA